MDANPRLRPGLVRGAAARTVAIEAAGQLHFLTKVQARILRPGLQALDLRITSAAPPPLRTAYAALETASGSLDRKLAIVP